MVKKYSLRPLLFYQVLIGILSPEFEEIVQAEKRALQWQAVQCTD